MLLKYYLLELEELKIEKTKKLLYSSAKRHKNLSRRYCNNG